MWFQQITHTGVACVTLCLIYLCARMPLYTVCVWYLAKQSAICRLFPTFVLTHKENEVGWLHSSRAWIDTFLKYVNKSVQKKHSDWTAATVWTRAAVFLTFCAEARAGGEAGHIDDLYSKLLACVPVNAAPHHTEGTPATHTHTHPELVTDADKKHIHKSGTWFFRGKCLDSAGTHTLSALGRHRAIFENRHHSLYTRANGNYRVVACSTAVKAKIKALL